MLSHLKKKYNLPEGKEERPLISRFALHAYSIKFEGLDGKDIYAEGDYPKDFAVLIKQLDKNSGR